MNFKPVGERVLVKIKAVEETTESGIFLAPNATSHNYRPSKATVLSVGQRTLPDGSIKPLSVVVGDTVMVLPSQGVEIEGGDGSKYRLINELDILGILTGE